MSADSLFDSSVDTLVVNEVSAVDLVTSSVETLVVNEESPDSLATSSVDTLVVNEVSAAPLTDSSSETLVFKDVSANACKLNSTLTFDSPYSINCAVIPDGEVITGPVNNLSDCKSKTILVLAI